MTLALLGASASSIPLNASHYYLRANGRLWQRAFEFRWSPGSNTAQHPVSLPYLRRFRRCQPKYQID
jgi:hypothetical protein